jgi:hypothetical protein
LGFVVGLALQKKRQAKEPVVKIQKPESAVAVMSVIPSYFYVTRGEVLSRKHLEGFSTERSLIFGYCHFLASHVALFSLLEVNTDVLEEATLFIIRIDDLF